MRESGIQAAEAIIAGGAAGAAAATRSVENQTFNILRGGGDWLDRTLRIPKRPPGLAPPPDEVPPPQIIGRPSEVEPLLERAGQRAAEVERAAAQDIEQFAAQQLAEAEASEGFATAAEAATAGAEVATAAEAGRCRRRRCSRTNCLGHRGRPQCGVAHDGLGCIRGRRPESVEQHAVNFLLSPWSVCPSTP